MDGLASAAEKPAGLRFRDTAPEEAVGPPERIAPIRKPEGFKPAVQRWSFLLPQGEAGLRLAFFGAQASDLEALSHHPLLGWAERSLAGHRSGPTCVDYAVSPLSGGRVERVVAAYWVNEARFLDWRDDEDAQGWWDAPERLEGDFGSWREVLGIPRDR